MRGKISLKNIGLGLACFLAIVIWIAVFIVLSPFDKQKSSSVSNKSSAESTSTASEASQTQCPPCPKCPPCPECTQTTPVTTPTPSQSQYASWHGPELWEEVNKIRRERQLPDMSVSKVLCTIAAERLVETKNRGQVSHEGFQEAVTRNSAQLAEEGIYTTVYEFLTQGYPTAEEAARIWDSTMAHSDLYRESYTRGCAYADQTFGVVIATY